MVNNVVLVGNITRDIEMNMSNTGTEVCRFTVAVQRNRKNAQGGYDADFISCVAFGQTARFMSQYLRKGSKISVVGRIQTGSYDNQQGQRVYTTDVIAESVNSLDSRQDSQYGQNNFGGMNNNGFNGVDNNFNQPANNYSQPQNNNFGQQTPNYAQPNNNNVTTISNDPYNNSNQDNNGASPITDDDLPF